MAGGNRHQSLNRIQHSIHLKVFCFHVLIVQPMQMDWTGAHGWVWSWAFFCGLHKPSLCALLQLTATREDDERSFLTFSVTVITTEIKQQNSISKWFPYVTCHHGILGMAPVSNKPRILFTPWGKWKNFLHMGGEKPSFTSPLDFGITKSISKAELLLTSSL